MVKFLILELGGWWMAVGRWWRFGGAPILIKVRGFCVAGFMVKFLIFELGGEELEGAAELGAEAGLVAVEAFEAVRVNQAARGRPSEPRGAF
jgi:hypothetical protein